MTTAALLLAAPIAVTNAPVASVVATNAPTASVSATNAVPPRIVTTWNQAQRELKRTAAQQADGTLDAAGVARRRAAVARAFERVCRQKGISEETIRYWRGRIENGEGELK